MNRRLLQVVFKCALLVALAASTVLFVDYRGGTTSFCGAASGCAEVRASPYSSILGIGLPTIGMGVFAGLLALALAARTRGNLRVLAALACLAGLGALGLIALQLVVVGALCKWCMAADVAALVAAGAALALAVSQPDVERMSVRMLWALAGVTAVATPLLVAAVPSGSSLPAAIAELQAPDKVTIVTFTDFECPFCRVMHPVIEQAAEEHPARVAVVRLMKPLKMHAGAEPAARAYLCAPDEQRDALADRLYGAAFGMQRDTVLAMAADLGIDRQALETCYDAPATSERLERDQRLFEAASLRGLPSTFVGPVLIEGAEVDDFHAALRHELSGAGGGALWAFAALAAAVLAAVMASLLTARGARAAPA